MDYVDLGRTGLRVSVAGIGTGGHSRLGLRQGGTTAAAVAVIHAALDRGVTLIDTAAVYATEGVVREALSDRRGRAVISTKVKVTLDDRAGAEGPLIDGAELARRVDACLRRLGMDCVDILHLHGVRGDEYATCRNRLIPALQALRDQGKIRFFGITEKFDEDTAHEMLPLALQDDLWDVLMLGLNIVNQTATRSVLPEARRQRVGTLCMYAVRAALADRESLKPLIARLVAKGEIDRAQIDPDDPLGFVLAESDARSLSEAAYRFCRHSAGIDVVLTGTGKIAHLEENLRAITAGPLPAAVVARLARLFAGVHSESGDPPGGFAATASAKPT